MPGKVTGRCKLSVYAFDPKLASWRRHATAADVAETARACRLRHPATHTSRAAATEGTGGGEREINRIGCSLGQRHAGCNLAR
jgi:hypothetical protein